MSRLRWIPVIAAALAATTALPAAGYQLFSQTVAVSGVSPERWQHLPLDVVVDQERPELPAEVQDAMSAWNAVPTAQDPWGTATASAVDFTEDNLGSAWGDLSGDGRYEVMFDADGKALEQLGIAPASTNGFGPRHELVSNGQAVIDDMFLIVNGSPGAPFDRRSTEVHELGHTLGLAHSTVGFAVGKDGALSPELESQVPTMHPFSIAGDGRRTLEADDRAAISELYPEPSFASTTATIKGRVTRCDTELPVSGADVRLIDANDPSVQLTRMTDFDGGIEGAYTIKGVPPGDYFVVVEPLAGDDDFVDKLAIYSELKTDFTQEYYTGAKEADCAQDTDPDARESVSLPAGGTETIDLKVASASLAFAIDVTGSMGPELEAAKTALNTMVSALEAASVDIPRTAIVTFRDDATIRTVTSDPAKLHDVIDSLTTSSTPDCPEGANAALMTAGRLLGAGGLAILVTDADSHPNGPSRETVERLYSSKGARLNTLLSGDCSAFPAPRAAAAPAFADPPFSGNTPDQPRPVDRLGRELSVRTFSEESLFTGGLFDYRKDVKARTTEALTRYANALANLGVSAAAPAVAAADPPTAPRGTTLTLQLTGAGTGFRAGSTVAVAGAGISIGAVDVRSPTRIDLTLTVAPDASLGFRDVTVTTPLGDGGSETAKGIGAVEILAAPATPAILSVTPGSGAAGVTEDVTISGALMHFGAGSVAGFGAGVTVNRLTVASPTSAVANVTVAPDATADFRAVGVHTPGFADPAAGTFLVTPATPALPRLTGASRRTGARGTTVDVVLTGADTAFAAGTSLASVSGTGVQVTGTEVIGSTEAQAHLRIAPDAPLGFRDLAVVTGLQTATLLDGFEVTPAVVPTVSATPIGSPQPAPTATPPPTCADRARPRASFDRGRRGLSVARGRLRLHGRASDAGCAFLAGRVARVEVAISRAAPHRRCRFLARLTKPRSCARPVWHRAAGTTRWSLTTKRLPRGRYTIRLRARDAAGNLQARPATRAQRVK